MLAYNSKEIGKFTGNPKCDRQCDNAHSRKLSLPSNHTYAFNKLKSEQELNHSIHTRSFDQTELVDKLRKLLEPSIDTTPSHQNQGSRKCADRRFETGWGVVLLWGV
jgi:hypothetical protein